MVSEAAASAPARSSDDALRRLIEERSFRDDREFVLASGRKSHVFFDLKKTMLDARGIRLIAERVLEAVRREPDIRYLGGVIVGAVPIVVATVMLSGESGSPLKGFWIRDKAKDHGTRNLIDGHAEAGAEAIIVEDVTTTGGSAIKAVEAAREAGIPVSKVVTVIDREEGARDNLARHGLELIAIFTKSDFSDRI